MPAQLLGRALDHPFAQAAQLARDPERFFARRLARFGDPFVVRLPGAAPLWVTGSSEGARTLFKAAPDSFEPAQPNPVEPLLGAGSLILLSGERHQRERKLLGTPFRGPCMQAFGQTIREVTREVLQDIRPGARFAAQELARRITLRIIVEVVFGIRDAARRAQFEHAIRKMLGRYLAPLMLAPPLRVSVAGVGPWERFVRARAAFRALLQQELRQRRERAGERRTDVLGLLLDLRYDDGTTPTDDALIDELCTLLVAGHDTTTIALSWALYFVHRDAHVLTDLREELDSLGNGGSASQLAALPYLRAVGDEAMRVHPVVPIVVRRLTRSLRLGEHTLPQGESVALALTLLHRDPALYPQPEAFRPARFRTTPFTPFDYAPFGGGARRCLGASFAGLELRIVLATLLCEASFALLTPEEPRAVLHGITMGPARPIVLTRLH